jgi:hypothetical protein
MGGSVVGMGRPTGFGAGGSGAGGSDSPSMSTCGSSLDSQPGSHQTALPNSVSMAGASDSTMALASSTATDNPTPNCLMVGSPLRMKLPNTEIMMIAAAAITLALEATPERTACRGDSPAA